MSYVERGMRPVDFSVSQYGQSKHFLRGTRVNLTQNYWVCLGGINTYAPHVIDPFSRQMERLFKIPVVNMGILHAGPDAILADQDLVKIIKGADMVIVEPLSSINQTNPYYCVHPRRNDRFIKPHEKLAMGFGELDVTDCHFTRHLLHKMAVSNPASFADLPDVLAQTWSDKMAKILHCCRNAVLWLAPQLRSQDGIHEHMGLDQAIVHKIFPRVIECDLGQARKTKDFDGQFRLSQSDHTLIARVLAKELTLAI